jgi:hypothetical protein
LEHEQGRSLGERLVLARELALELADLASIGGRLLAPLRGTAESSHRLGAPLVELCRVHALAAQPCAELGLGHRGCFEDQREFLLDGALRSIGNHQFLLLAVLPLGHLVAKRSGFPEPTRQRRLRHAGLGGELHPTHRLGAGHLLDHARAELFAVLSA